MVNDEGLRSYKAIAFISKGNPKRTSLNTKNYFTLGFPRQKTVLTKQKTLRGFSINLGEKSYG